MDSPSVAPVVKMGSLKDMLVEETTFTPSHQPWHIKFADTFQDGLTSAPCRLQEEVTLPPKLVFKSHPEETGLNVAVQES